jgi:alpha-tubulin suppressor-like RCC1 family protein
MDGQLGLGDYDNRGDGVPARPDEMGAGLPTVNVGPGHSTSIVKAGFEHTCAVLDNYALKCWGANRVGQLGLGDLTSRGDGPNEMGDFLPTIDLGAGRTVSAVAGGYGHTCAVLDNNSVKCWGQNDFGQLGLGDTNNRGDEPGEMGAALPTVDLGGDWP